jgi:hypothetical protein
MKYKISQFIGNSELGPYIGAGAGGVILLLVGVLVLIICTIGLLRRRGKRKRTHYEHIFHYRTVQEGEQHAHSNCSKQTYTEKNINHTTEGSYEKTETKDFPQVPTYSDLMTSTVSSDELKKAVTDTSATDSVTECSHVDMKYDHENDNDGKYRNSQHSDSPYIEMDVTSKNDKQKEKTTKQNVNEPCPEIDLTNKNDKEIAKTSQETVNDCTAATASHSNLKIQDKVVSTTQPSPSANTEGLYAEVDKTQKKKNRVEK